MIHNLLKVQNQNPFFSGGLSLMVVGAAVALLCKVPGQLWTSLQRRLSITVEVPDRDPAFCWLQAWLANQPYAAHARDLSVATTWVPASADCDAAVVFDPDDSTATSQVLRGKICVAAIQEHLLRHHGAPEAAAHEVDFDDQLADPRKTENHALAMVVQAT